MHFKKLMSAGTAFCLTATSLFGTAASSLIVTAADEVLTFDIQSGGQNTVTVSAESIKSSDYTIPVSIYIPENPGVCAVNLKFQINDGEVDANNVFHNYGFSLLNGGFADPNVFAASDGASVLAYFVPDTMNLSWVYSLDGNTNGVAADEANTSAWNSSVSWAYDKAFVTANLVVPSGAAPGTYTFDIRTETYVNLMSSSTNPLTTASKCAAADSESALSFKSIPLSIVVEAESETTTTTTSTTTSSETTTTTTTTTSETTTTTTETTVTTTSETTTSTSSMPVLTGDPWVDDYKIEGQGHYIIMGDEQAAPGEEVLVPVYVYGDTGTAGVNFKFGYDKALTLGGYLLPKTEDLAYNLSDQQSTDLYPATYTGITSDGTNVIAEDGKQIILLYFIVPEDAKDGTVYEVTFADGFADICDTDGTALDVKLFNGSITVVSDGKTCLNRDKITFSQEGETANLTLFNALGDVTWSSSDPEVATVDQNGFVTATGNGSATITADNQGVLYTASVIVGLFGDANLSGKVTIEDAKLVLNEHAAVNLSFSDPLITDPVARYNADVDGNGVVNLQDAKYILNYVTMQMSFLNPTWYEVTGNPNAPDAP